MLEELEVINGKLDLNFDKYNYIYTVSVKPDVERLNITFEVTSGYKVKIINNKLTNDETSVYIKVYNEKEVNTYTLLVNKEIEQTTSLIDDYKRTLEVQDASVPMYKIVLIGSTCFIVLLIVFLLLFKRKKRS